MASKLPECEMCCMEQAVGCCNTCGNIGESCLGIHKRGKRFQTHILKMYGKDGYDPKCIMYDITEEMCIHHPTERALLFCKKDDSMICGRCLHSDHLSCGNEVVDLCQELRQFHYEQTNAMNAALNEIKDESKRMKEEVEKQNERSDTHAAKCNTELEHLGIKLKRKVEDAINSVKQEACKLNEENKKALSCISSVCEEKVSWAISEESKLNDFVNNSFTGRLYLMNRNFEKGISKAKRQIKEAEHNNTFKSVYLKENTAALKCLIEDLNHVCELPEEVDGSDDGTTFSIGNSTVENEKTRMELIEDFIQVKLDKDKAETARNEFKEQLLQAKRDLEKTREKLCDELQQVKQKLDHSEKTRQKLCNELKEVKQDRDNSDKTRKGFEQDLQKAKQGIEKSEKIKKGIEEELLRVKQGLDNTEKSMQELGDELKKVKEDRDASEKTREKLCDELQQVKQKLDHSEKTRKGFEQDLQKKKQDIEKSEKSRQEVGDELKEVKQVRDSLEKTRRGLEQDLKKAKQDIEESEKTRERFEQDLQKVKQDIDKSEKIRKGIEQELLQVKQGLDNSEKIRNGIEQELLQVKQGLDNSEKCRQELCDELKEVKQDRDNSEKTKKGLEQDLQKAKQDIQKSEKECTTLQAKCTHLKDCIKWTQPTGALEVKINMEQRLPIKCVFTFPDGIQTKYNRRPGKPYKGGTITGSLKDDNEGQLVCRMLKAAFRKGLMFTVNEYEWAGLDGFSLFRSMFTSFVNHDSYDEYIHKVKAKLAAKGITETNIDLTEKLEETFTVEGP
ncbi:myosin-2 heavy chain, non muscle-like isoform X2 [Mya arenaria]|uniref:myosin-2 heavy chain, non muscle-like isoform X2 n=1 Tax=Mya arenaria TaxID=6604 RepID=UPI0022E13B88|nr:myosin-2 heavy chain, non muscle-like isoform X2 [Mya arenaria]